MTSSVLHRTTQAHVLFFIFIPQERNVAEHLQSKIWEINACIMGINMFITYSVVVLRLMESCQWEYSFDLEY